MVRVSAVATLSLAVAAGCYHPDDFCEGAPKNRCSLLGDAPPTGCSSNAECAVPTPVCDLAGSMSCVQCTAAEPSACTAATPVCGADAACRGCSVHTECASAACLPDGSCADEATVAYVSAGGTGTTCTKAAPCSTLNVGLATRRAHVKVSGTVDEAATARIQDQNVTVLAEPGAKLTRSNNGVLLEVRGTSQVKIYDLEIGGASGTMPGQGIGIYIPAGNTVSLALARVKVAQNTGVGISCDGGSLTVTRSIISGNTGGGIIVSGAGATFVIANNFIYRNGNSTTAACGGVDIAVTAPGASRLEFNTIVDNTATSGPLSSGGVRCAATSFAAPNNIIARNLVGASTTDSNAQTLGACTYPTSTVATSLAGLGFVQADAAPFNYHLTTASSAIDQGTTATTITNDIDGETRPKGAGADQGADEVR